MTATEPTHPFFCRELAALQIGHHLSCSTRHHVEDILPISNLSDNAAVHSHLDLRHGGYRQDLLATPELV
jgi:hypothetical protein